MLWANRTRINLFIFKTNTCSFFGLDVQKIKNRDEALKYIKEYSPTKCKYEKKMTYLFQNKKEYENHLNN